MFWINFGKGGIVDIIFFLTSFFALILSIANTCVDHMRRDQRIPDDEDPWEYYEKLSKRGNLQAKFIVFSGHSAVVLIAIGLIYLFFATTQMDS